MKRYYRNWYQHYLELQAEKERELQRGYYSNLAPKTEKNKPQEITDLLGQEQADNSVSPVAKRKKEKEKFRLRDLLLPVMTICAFGAVWYHFDLGPVRAFVNDGLVWVGIRAETVDVISYHVSLLDQHVEFAEAVANFMAGEHELSFADLDALYDQIRLRHQEVIEVSTPVYAEAVRLWDFKIASTRQMLNWLQNNEDLPERQIQFLTDQDALATMIRRELASLE